MVKDKPKFYVTTPIYYVNDSPHVGSAYTTIAADIIARFYRLLDYDVFFLTGTDEHGQKLEDASKAAGMAPKQFADKVVLTFKEAWQQLAISNDHFVRTTDDYHQEFCKWIYSKMKDNGDIYKGNYEGLYCVGCEKFVKDIDLVDGLCPLHKKAPEHLKEESYFFRLSRYQKELLEFYEKNPDFIAPGFRKHEIINRVQEGLNDLSISRTSITWGIPIPGDPAHVMYVWIDALSNYVSVLGYPGPKYEKFWPADVHLIGKDIAWFHMVIWPAMLMSAGLPLPKKVFAHGFWTVDGQKMGKALGNIVRPLEMKERYGIDTFRYYLFSKAQFGQDNDFSEKELVEVLNTELANDFGNLINRVIVLVQNYFGGVVPVPATPPGEEVEFQARFHVLDQVRRAYMDFDFSMVLKTLWDLLRYMNKCITDASKGGFKNKDKAILGDLLFRLLEGLRIVVIWLQPVMPGTCKQVLDAFGLPPAHRGIADATWRNGNGFARGGTLAVKTLILFTKKDYSPDPTVGKPGDQVKLKSKPPTMEKNNMSEQKHEPLKPVVSFDDFMKIDLRTAKILAAELLPKSKKLVKLQVDLGSEKRTIVAGIIKQYPPDQLVGRNIIVVANLAPKELGGTVSQGMLLAADINGEPILLQPDKDVTPGTPIH
ncbi:MAG: methionine--tRNA ligase [Candidatus Lokiarchaeota archaeon]|nr:methionine--tRNA ligase [Candidatus Lokiarchaeota archaeon]